MKHLLFKSTYLHHHSIIISIIHSLTHVMKQSLPPPNTHSTHRYCVCMSFEQMLHPCTIIPKLSSAALTSWSIIRHKGLARYAATSRRDWSMKATCSRLITSWRPHNQMPFHWALGFYTWALRGCKCLACSKVVKAFGLKASGRHWRDLRCKQLFTVWRSHFCFYIKTWIEGVSVEQSGGGLESFGPWWPGQGWRENGFLIYFRDRIFVACLCIQWGWR